MSDDVAVLLDGFKKKDLRALSRLISFAENRHPSAITALADLYAKVGHSRVIGLTGPPGAGKSTLTGSLIKLIRSRRKTVGVIAVDPVSPYSGGALLGDRIRLVDHFNDPGVFIRSLSTRGKLGGLSLATREVAHLISAFGFDYLIIETVGVGQSEVDVRKLADVTVVLLVPEWGDAIQTLKAGLLEIGDLFVVNKADREGAEKLGVELKSMLHMAGHEDISVLLSHYRDDTLIGQVSDAIEAFFNQKVDLIQKRRVEAARGVIHGLIESQVLAETEAWVSRQSAQSINPYQDYLQFLTKHPLGSLLSDA